MKIADCVHRTAASSDYHYKLDLLLQGDIHLVMECAVAPRTGVGTEYHFRVYYEHSGIKGHIAAFTPGARKMHSLPEYNNIMKIFPTLERHEAICLALELVLYYDSDHVMVKLPLGNKYPITLPQLMDGILEGVQVQGQGGPTRKMKSVKKYNGNG
jgi:hypothetical protein